MAFPEEPIRTPTAICDIRVTLFSPDPLGDALPGATFDVQVRYSTGEIRNLTGDLLPHLSQAQINGLISFMNDMRTKAVAEFLP